MQKNEEYWIWLTNIKGIGPVAAGQLIRHFHDPVAVYEAMEKDLILCPGLNRIQRTSILESHDLDEARGILEKCRERNIGLLTVADDEYPRKAAELPDAPVLLYTRGTQQLIGPSVAIVGSRRCTREERAQAIELAEQYTADGFCIVSGMAKGVDSYAHTACLQSNGYTVAVLGNGPDICYPAEHKALMERIIEKGLIISEYPPGTDGSRYTFPRRNRLISGWADEVVVITSGKKSGAHITEQYAEKYGRKIIG